MSRFVSACTLLVGVFTASSALAQSENSRDLRVANATIRVTVRDTPPAIGMDALCAWVQRSAESVVALYGQYPVAREEFVVHVVAGRSGVLAGTTWGDMQGWPARTRLSIGRGLTRAEMDDDWILIHEMIHTAMPTLPDEQSWFEEGVASYVEPLARAQHSMMAADTVWREMIEGMPQGEPEAGDRGLDRTHTWGRTYWGGALFCLVADVEIRKRTHNRFGLQDGLRAVVAHGGSIAQDGTITDVLKTTDAATGTTVLEEMYAVWSKMPVTVDLPKLWAELGVRVVDGKVRYDDKAPFADVRRAMTAARSH